MTIREETEADFLGQTSSRRDRMKVARYEVPGKGSPRSANTRQ